MGDSKNWVAANYKARNAWAAASGRFGSVADRLAEFPPREALDN